MFAQGNNFSGKYSYLHFKNSIYIRRGFMGMECRDNTHSNTATTRTTTILHAYLKDSIRYNKNLLQLRNLVVVALRFLNQ